MRFYRTDTHTIQLIGIGSDGQVTRQAGVNMTITKDNEVLNYAIASRGRMWLTGQSTIHGDVFSSWDRPEISPFNMTSDTTVLVTQPSDPAQFTRSQLLLASRPVIGQRWPSTICPTTGLVESGSEC